MSERDSSNTLNYLLHYICSFLSHFIGINQVIHGYN